MASEEIRQATIAAYKAAKSKIASLERFTIPKGGETPIREEKMMYGLLQGTAKFDNTDMQKYKLEVASWRFSLAENDYPMATWKIEVPGHHVLRVTEAFASQLTTAFTTACEEAGFNDIYPIGENVPRGKEAFELWANALVRLH